MKSANKSPKLAPPSPRNGNRLPLGAHPGNSGGKPGRSGRIPSSVTLLCQEAISKNHLIEQLVRIALHGDKNSDRISAARVILEYGEGKPIQRQELTGLDGHEIPVSLNIFDANDLTD